MTEGRSLFAAVIEDHLELKRRNAHLNTAKPLTKYAVADPFDNNSLFKSEAQARREEEETGEIPALVVDWPAAVGVDSENEEAWLDAQQCSEFTWGD